MTTILFLQIIVSTLSGFTIGWFLGKRQGERIAQWKREKRVKTVMKELMDHLGKRQPGPQEPPIEDQLMESLKEALDNEDYEKAAQIRDLLNRDEET